MPTPEKPYNIGVKLSGATANATNYVIFRNRTKDEYKKFKVVTDVVCNLVKLTDDGSDTGTHTVYSNGDDIEIEVYGADYGGTTHTVNTSTAAGTSKKITIPVTAVSTTNTAAVSF